MQKPIKVFRRRRSQLRKVTPTRDQAARAQFFTTYQNEPASPLRRVFFKTGGCCSSALRSANPRGSLAPPPPGLAVVVHHAALDRARSHRLCELRRPRVHEAVAHHAVPFTQLTWHALPTVRAYGATAAHVMWVWRHAYVRAHAMRMPCGVARGSMVDTFVMELAGPATRAWPAVLPEAHIAKVLVAVGAAVGLRRDVVAAVAVPLGDRHVAAGAPPAGGVNVRVRRRRGRALRVRRVRPPPVLAVWAAQPARAAAAAIGGDIGPR